MTENTHSVSVLEPPNQTQAKALVTPAPASEKKPGLWPWLVQSGPTFLVLVLLAGLAYWGHHTGWTMPKFEALFGGGEQSNGDWCAEHSVPESICVECDESLLPRLKSAWCRTHGVHACPFERPDLAQVKNPPPVTKDDLDRAQRALDLKERSENNSKCKMHQRRLQLASEEVLNKMGIDILPVAYAPIVETVVASGEITFEQPRVAPLASPVAGRVWYVTEKGQIGAVVQRGNVLAVIDAVEVGKAKAEFLQAFAQLDLRAKSLDNIKDAVAKGAISQARFLELDTAMREGQIRLLGAQQALVNLGLPIRTQDIKGMAPENLARYMQFLGIPDVLAKRLDAETTSANLFPILAPRDGIVTAAKTVPGEVVDPTKTLFVVADTSQMWLILNVRNEDVKYLKTRDAKAGKPGQTVKFRPDGSAEDVTGELVWKSTQVDEKTRTVQFRAELPNPNGTLLANTFGMGHVVLREEKNAVVIPNESLHWEGDCNIVFVRDKNFLEPGAPKVFHVRTVRPGVKTATYTEIIAGLLPGEVVATKNSASLRAELRKNSLGAG